jgi:hypothetical protein
MKRNGPVSAPKRNTVGTEPAARHSARVHRRADDRETHSELLSAYGHDLESRIQAAPLSAVRQWRRHWDYTAAPTAFLTVWVLCGLLRLLNLVPVHVPVLSDLIALATNTTRILPVWVLAVTAAALTGYWVWTGTHRRRARDRWLEDDGAAVRELFRPRYRTIDIEKLPHRRTDYGRTPRGYSAEQYQDQTPVARDSLGHPVTIRSARPGIIAITQTYIDLMAEPVPWRPALELDPNPERLWLGTDHDGEDVHVPLTSRGSGLAHLLAGSPGSGKSAATNALLSQVVAYPHRRLWVIDPADGVDLGCWHPFAYRLAETPAAGLQLLRDLIRDMESRRPLMTAAGIDLCLPSAAFPWNLLVMDELPELTLNEDKKVAAEACELIARIRRVGRKTNTSIIAITQDVSRDVVPRAISKIFSHRLCFKVSTYHDADIVLPGARRHGYHPEQFDPDHPGRLILWDLSTYIECRAAGLYGPARAEVVRRLSTPRPETVQTVNGHSPDSHRADRPASLPHTPTTQTDILSTPQPPPATPTNGSATSDQRSAHDLRVLLNELGTAAGRVGLNVPALSVEISEPDWRIRRTLNALGYVKRNGNFVQPEAAR